MGKKKKAEQAPTALSDKEELEIMQTISKNATQLIDGDSIEENGNGISFPPKPGQQGVTQRTVSSDEAISPEIMAEAMELVKKKHSANKEPIITKKTKAPEPVKDLDDMFAGPATETNNNLVVEQTRLTLLWALSKAGESLMAKLERKYPHYAEHFEKYKITLAEASQNYELELFEDVIKEIKAQIDGGKE